MTKPRRAPSGAASERGNAAPSTEVSSMFDGIAGVYDPMNLVISAFQEPRWRRRAVAMAQLRPGGRAIDVATGTGKVAADLQRRVQPGGEVLGVDISPGMIGVAQRRFKARPGLTYVVGDALALPAPDASFDAATIAFGMRNLPDYRQGFAEMRRVVRPGGRVVCLEIARPRSRLARILRAWFDGIVPLIGRLAGQGGAYAYLVRSVRNYPAPEAIAGIMRDAGLVDVTWTGMSGGIVTLHVGTVPPGDQREGSRDRDRMSRSQSRPRRDRAWRRRLSTRARERPANPGAAAGTCPIPGARRAARGPARSRPGRDARRAPPRAGRRPPAVDASAARTSSSCGAIGVPRQPHRIVRSFGSTLNVTPWSTPWISPSGRTSRWPPFRSALLTTASNSAIRRRRGSPDWSSVQDVHVLARLHPELQHPGAEGALRAEDRRRHDLPACGLRDGMRGDLAVRERRLREVPQRPLAADRLVDGSRGDRPAAGDVAGDPDQQRRVRRLDEPAHDLEVPLVQEAEREIGWEVDRGGKLGLGLGILLAARRRAASPAVVVGRAPRHVRAPARTASPASSSGRSMPGRLSARSRSCAGRCGRWDRGAVRRTGTAAGRRRRCGASAPRRRERRAASAGRAPGRDLPDRCRRISSVAGSSSSSSSAPRPPPLARRRLVAPRPHPRPRPTSSCSRASMTTCSRCGSQPSVRVPTRNAFHERLAEGRGVVVRRRQRLGDLDAAAADLRQEQRQALGEHLHLDLLDHDRDEGASLAGLQEERAMTGLADGAGRRTGPGLRSRRCDAARVDLRVGGMWRRI